MSLYNLIPDDGSLWSIRAVDISGNYNQKLNFDASGNAIIQTGNIDRLTINSSGAWTYQGGMTYNNATNTLTAGTFSGAVSGTATTATNIAGGAGGSIPYQSAASTTAFLANGTSGQVLTSAGTTLAPTWTTPSGAAGFYYTADTTTQDAPSSNGQITWNNATQSSSSILNIYTRDTFGNLIRSYFNSIYPIGSVFKLIQRNNPANYQIWETTFIGDNILYVDVGVTLLNESSFYSFSNNDPIQLIIDEVGTLPQNLSEVLTMGNSAGASSIDMSGNDITNGGTFTANSFAGTATRATNIAGGLGGSIPYQSAVNTTALLANGTAGQVLTSAGTTLAPTWTTIATAGNSSNSASKIYNEDFNWYNFSSAPYGPLSMLFTNATFLLNGFASRVGVIQLTSPSFVGTGYGASFVSAPSGVLTPANSEGIMPSAISNSTTGLGMTFIFYPNQASYASADILFGLARWDTFAVFTAGYNNITIYYNATTQKWGGRIGNAFTPFPSVPTGTLNGKWIVGRIIPSSTGATFYLYNTTDSVDYGTVSILYSADTAGTTASTIYMRIGGGIKSFSASSQNIYCDYCGFETNFQRIYP